MGDSYEQCDVLVVGAGPIGCAAALAMARAGFAVTLFDRTAPRFDNRTVAIDPAGQSFLVNLGIWSELRDHACAITSMAVTGKPAGQVSPFGELFLDAPQTRRSPDARHQPLAHMLTTAALHRALLAAVQDHPTCRTDFAQAFAGVELSGDTIRANQTDGKLLIAADGIRSAVRQAANITNVRRDYRQSALTAVVSHPQPHHGVAYQRFTSGGPIASLPLRDDDNGTHRSSIVWSDRAELIEAWETRPLAEIAGRATERLGAKLGQLTFAEPPASFPLTAQVAQRFFAPRIALVGEAAHHIHPLAGQGMNLGLRDIAVLAELLTDARALGGDIGGPGLLDSYQRARKPEADRLYAVTDGLNGLFSAPAPVQHLARLGMSLVNGSPLKRLLTAEMTRS